jgi:hypothetical protein
MGWRAPGWSGRHSTFKLNGGFLYTAARGGFMDTAFFVVVAIVVLFMGGFAALVAYSNKPEKENREKTTKEG